MDAVLATRGWTPEAFRIATPEFLDAAHHALIVQQFAPDYRELTSVQATSTTGWTPDQKLSFVARQIQANELLPRYRAHLFPEDDDE